MENISFDKFSKLIDENLALRDDNGNTCELTVVKVEESKHADDEWERFSVMLKGPKSIKIPTGTYAVSHSAIGEQSLFIDPKGPVDYEMIFNFEK